MVENALQVIRMNEQMMRGINCSYYYDYSYYIRICAFKGLGG